MTAKDLSVTEYNPYYKTYIDKAGTLDLENGLKTNFEAVDAFLSNLPNDKLEYRYEEGKWTIKEVIQHIIDTERVFTYRALRIARKDRTPLPGFDQDEFALNCDANRRTLKSLMNEYKAVRMATIALYDSFTEEMLMEIGTASNSALSVRAVAFITIGHENHHCKVIKERYL